jgi:hypothetical protein
VTAVTGAPFWFKQLWASPEEAHGDRTFLRARFSTHTAQDLRSSSGKFAVFAAIRLPFRDVSNTRMRATPTKQPGRP